MKLIDVLIKELPRRGSWPDGVVAMAMDPDGRVFGYKTAPEHSTLGWRVNAPGNTAGTDGCGHYLRCDVDGVESWQTAIITREQYDAALSASKKPEWNGEGLPPVGVECEMSFGGDEWSRCVIIAKGEEQIIYQAEGCREFSGHRNNYSFRPIRSEADRKRDLAVSAMADICRNSASNAHSAELIYDVIATGGMPGIRIE